MKTCSCHQTENADTGAGGFSPRMLCSAARAVSLIAIASLLIISAGCSSEDSDEIERNTRKLILSSDMVELTTSGREEDGIVDLERQTFLIKKEAFRKQLADAIEFGDIIHKSGSNVAVRVTTLQFYESGILTLTLQLVGQPDSLSGGRQPVFVHDHTNHKKVEIESTADLYDTIESEYLVQKAEA